MYVYLCVYLRVPVDAYELIFSKGSSCFLLDPLLQVISGVDFSLMFVFFVAIINKRIYIREERTRETYFMLCNMRLVKF